MEGTKRLNSYIAFEYPQVMIFELFMPLANESGLRSALDSLFYKDTVIARLNQAGPARLQQSIPRRPQEDAESYLERICQWVDRKFHGYSIYHVNGRFRSAGLLTLREACGMIEDGREYLIDETTAVVLFILPCETIPPGSSMAETCDNTVNEAVQIRFCFETLVVQSVLETAEEKEIWVLESGLQSALHVWRKT